MVHKTLSDDTNGGFEEIEPIDDIPNILKPLPTRSMAQGMSMLRPLEEMVEDVEREAAI